MSKGFDKVYALKDGFDAWNRAGYPVEKLKRGS
jgi:rhodanese-related sulfurtransferase